MIGAIAGDVIGSVYENLRTKRKDFRLFTPLSTFTDDTVLTVAVSDAILQDADYGETIKRYARKHPMRGYGPRFLKWMATPGIKPYNSFGNGSAMRVSPVAYAFDTEDAVRNAVSLGGDADTQACIAGAIAEAHYGGVPPEIADKVIRKLSLDLRHIVETFCARYEISLFQS